MPSMYEIYDYYADEYDRLVESEDYRNNLKTAIHSLHDFTENTVIEFGTGTGRLTKMVADKAKKIICFDRSEHMLAKAEKNLMNWKPRITFSRFDHSDFCDPGIQGDVVLEGWAFGHVVKDCTGDIVHVVEKLVSRSERLVTPGGKVIIVETLGTNVNTPCSPDAALQKFYQLLEEQFGYYKTVISTDYKFSSVEEAELVMGFFFGEKIIPGIRQRNSNIIPEFTGIWTKDIV
jgi:ubiquinone/menaquinone biosynthesis C-methylase UbiE